MLVCFGLLGTRFGGLGKSTHLIEGMSISKANLPELNNQLSAGDSEVSAQNSLLRQSYNAGEI